MSMHEEHIATALNAAAALGQRVAVFAPGGAEAHELFEAFAAHLPEGYAVDLRRTSGRESFRFKGSGGEIRFYGLRSRGHRGWAADRAFVPVGISPDRLADIWPALNTSRVGVLTGF
ncbi:hypothetical protein ACIPY3_02575 [Paenarthrobacter sp. NPDC089714]|uniref:hypothetical protein n=1 Tax=Paenarthrobacter sp. NPDC089714 TaxID=3364377 RepID=UPI0038062D67